MRRKPYYPQLIEALRETLRELENTKMTSQDDPALAQLKAAILRTLTEQGETVNN